MRARTSLIIVLILVIYGCAASEAQLERHLPKDTCTVPSDDLIWIDRAVAAWHFVKRDIAGIAESTNFQAVLFSAACLVTSNNALTENARDAIWHAVGHSGTIKLPDGADVVARVTSFTRADETDANFVMALPSVWRKGSVDGGPPRP